MNILAINQKSYGIEHVVSTLKELGHSVTLTDLNIDDVRISKFVDDFFNSKVSANNYDAVFTFNYFPVISDNCKRHNIKYISWVYDSPHVVLYSYTIINSCNYIFLFDKNIYDELKNGGINTVYYLPLAADTDYYDRFKPNDSITAKYRSDVSFVGSLYNEKHRLYDKFNSLPPHTKGYIDGIITAQSKIYGYFFLPELLTEDITNEIQKIVPYPANKYGIEIKEEAPSKEEIQQRDEQDALFAVNEFACKYFQNNLLNTDEGKSIGLSYFNEREITQKTIDTWRLGYSKQKSNDFAQYALRSGYTEIY